MNFNPLTWIRGPKAAPAPPAPGREPVDKRSSPEQRSILENPSVPITPEQLSAMIGYAPTRSGVQIDEHSALTYVAVFAAIKIISESIAQLPLLVMRGGVDDDNVEKATDHPVYRLLRLAPNQEMTAVVWKETLQSHLCGWGNAYARIVLDRSDRPIALLPITPERIQPERYAGQLRYSVLNTNEYFFPEEILHIPGLGYNGLKGYSPIGLARENVALGKALEILGAQFIGSGAQLNGIVSFPNKLGPDQERSAREAFRQMHTGVGNAGKTLFLSGGGTYSRIGIPPQDAQFLESRKFQVAEIARLYRIPPHMLGDMTQGTGRNIEQMALEFLDTLNPWLVKWEEEINRKLLPDGNYHAKFDTKRLRRADLQSRQTYYAAARQWGWMSANDVRRHEGENPIGNQGNIYLSPLNMGAADSLESPPNPPTNESQGTPGDKAPDGDEDARAIAALRPIIVDAASRMLRREQKAQRSSKGNLKRFYVSHAKQSREALMSALASFRSLSRNSVAGDRLESAIAAFSAEQHDLLPDDLSPLAESKADGLISAALRGPGDSQ